eukprot:PhM_4_TR12029/c0_g4_i1/m.48462/K10632/BRAP; BRCA1-associated protein
MQSGGGTTGVVTFTYFQQGVAGGPSRENNNKFSLELSTEPTHTIVLRDIPNFLTPQEAMRLLSLDHENSGVSHVALILTMKPATYALLVRVNTKTAAQAFHADFNLKPLSSLGSDVLFVSYCCDAAATTSLLPHCMEEIEGSSCPVCLEPLISSAVVTSDCVHHLHLKCFLSLPEPNCPLCRHSITDVRTTCENCPATAALWMCLVCGFVGCGEDAAHHAHDHYELTKHTYAVELGTQKVWDFASRGYVHRVLATMDGDDVEPRGGEETFGAEKKRLALDSARRESSSDAIAMRYSRLLESQLLQQQRFYRHAHEVQLEVWVLESAEHTEEIERKKIMVTWMRELISIFEKSSHKMESINKTFLQANVLSAEEKTDMVRLEVKGAERGIDKYRAMVNKLQTQRREAEEIDNDEEVLSLRKRLETLYAAL